MNFSYAKALKTTAKGKKESGLILADTFKCRESTFYIQNEIKFVECLVNFHLNNIYSFGILCCRSIIIFVTHCARKKYNNISKCHIHLYYFSFKCNNINEK